MGKKSIFGLGLAAGAALAYAAYKRLDQDQQKQVVNKLNDGFNNLKERVTDYAFYASDALEDVKETLTDKANDAKDSIYHVKDDVSDKISDETDDYEQDSQFKTAADRLKDELNNDPTDDDIIVNADDVLKQNKKVETFYPNEK